MNERSRTAEKPGGMSAPDPVSFVSPLPLSLVRIGGEEAVPFLHGQLSSDVAALEEGRSQLSSYNSPKGRILALPRLLREGDGLRLRLPNAIAEPTVNRLRMFVLRAKVDVEITPWRALGLTGPEAKALLAEAGLAPEVTDTAAMAEGLRVIRVPGARPRFELWGAPAQVEAWRERAQAAGLTLADSTAWEYEEILAGLPEVYEETREAFVPQMVNLHRLGGVSFNKGCYPGQEVVARMHYLGKLKRRMFRAWSEGPPPHPGSPVRDEAGALQGQVVRAAPAPGGGSELLAVLALSAVAEGTALAVEGGGRLALRPLPYPMDDQA